MNKYGIVFGAAVVAVVAGCKDPDYKRDGGTSSQNDVKSVDTGAPAKAKPSGGYQIEPSPAKRCNCLPGTKHDKPCACGAPDCNCVVESKPIITANLADGSGVAAGKSVAAASAASAVSAEPETTIYIVQSGDYLAKISKKFNITIASIKKLNPSIKENNIVRVGQKLKLPGKVDVGVQADPAAAAKATVKKVYVPYTGATKEYVVKGGDTLGAIAYSNGINIRQLKELNGLSKDVLRVGQKLKIPAEKVVAAKTAPAKASAAPAKVAVEATKAAAEAAKADAAAADTAPTAPAADVAPVKAAADAAPAAEAAKAAAVDASAASPATYVVQEGDDMTGISIRWGVSAAEIRELNNLGEKDQLVPGQIIKLPADAQQ